MNLRMIDILKCSRSILFENGVAGYYYSMRGTGFICRFEGNDFFVTARHVVDGFPPECVCVPFFYGSREFIPYSSRLTVVGNDGLDTDWTDIAILNLRRSEYSDDDFHGEMPLDLTSECLDRTLEPGADLVLRGFPHHTNRIDYASSEIRIAGTSFGAKIVEPAPMKRCTKIQFNDLSACETLDGLSGAPVFSFDRSGPPYNMKLAGMMLRGTKSSGVGYMLDAEAVYQIVQRVMSY